MTPREVLLKAAELVERGWTSGAEARNAAAGKVSAHSPSATCWCALGACRAAANGDRYSYTGARDTLHASLFSEPDNGEGQDPVAVWNDAPGRTQAEVVAALKAAAETCA